MEITNRTLGVMLGLTLLLVVAAVGLSFGITLPGTAPQAPAANVDGVRKVEVTPIVTREGGVEIDASGPLQIRLEDGTHASSALLVCDLFKSERPVERGAVTFPKVPMGGCSIRLKGTDRGFAPVFPGDEISCMIVETETACTGGIVSEHAGIVTVEAQVPAELVVDGSPYGQLPLQSLRMKPGKRAITVRIGQEIEIDWSLVVQPEERIHIYFPAPEGYDPTATDAAG